MDMSGYGPAPRAPAGAPVQPYPAGTVPGTVPGLPLWGAPGMQTMPQFQTGLTGPGMTMPAPVGIPTFSMAHMPMAAPVPTAPLAPVAPLAALGPSAPVPSGSNDSFAAAVAAAAAALNQLGYAQPQPQDPLAAALASLGLGNVDLQSLGQSLQGLSIPGLDLASIGLESLANPSPTPGVVSRRGKGYKGPPKGPPKGKGGGKARIQDLPVLTSQEVQEPGVFVNAATQRDERKCRALLAHKDFNRVDDKDSEHRTAVHICILKKMPEDVCLGILNRDDFTEVNAVDQFGYTILSLAASNGMVNVCKAVLDHPEFTQVNSKDKWGATALHWAAASNLGSVCTAILEHPAFVEAHVVAFSFKFENQTALQVAEERGCGDAEQAIKKALSA
ncbi:unnamed protein product [Effrenium voratum]|uniref:Uncharacterized protein n=1 Tax=Effrenium voratum TaxID=2562239 RepID=A0AA36I3R9_9DINO|nr:unnamed protein product [Effrenium voratum]